MSLGSFFKITSLRPRTDTEEVAALETVPPAAPPEPNDPPTVLLPDARQGQAAPDRPENRPDAPASRSASDWPTVPGYEILSVLGRGGMGVVYKARQLSLRRLVALKMIRDGVLIEPDEHARFRREAEVVARLQHPHIVQIYEVGEHDRQPYFSLEFVEGGSLAQKLAGMPLPPRRAAALAQTLARAMHYAHQRGIVHRDLKPGNVLLTGEGVPKITDFGLAKWGEERETRLEEGGTRIAEGGATAVPGPDSPSSLLPPPSAPAATASGMIMGTPSYMAPEQAEGDSALIGPATDVYALGAMLYEMLTGRPPFRAETPLETILQVMSAEPMPPCYLQSQLPRDLQTICLKCLQKDPRKRYATADALAEDLRRFLEGVAIQAGPVPLWERGMKRVQRWPPWTVLLGVGLIAALGLAAAAVWHRLQLQDALEDARRACTTAQEQESQVRQCWYAAEMKLAYQLWKQGEVQQVQELLPRQQPLQGVGDLRGFEWYYLWRLCQTGQRGRLHQQEQAVHTLAFAPDGTLLVVAGPDRDVYLLDAATGQVQRTLPAHHGGVQAMAFSPDGQTLATAGADGPIRLWDTRAWRERGLIQAHPDGVVCLAFSPKGDLLASAGRDHLVKLWDPTTGQERATWTGHDGAIAHLAFAPDGQTLASASRDRSVQLWDVSERNERLRLEHADAVLALAFAPDGTRLATAAADGRLRLWDLRPGQEPTTWVGPRGLVVSLAFSPDGKTLATGSRDGTVKLWHVATSQELATLQGPTGKVSCLAFSPDGAILAAGGDSVQGNSAVYLWEAASREGLDPADAVAGP